jgi:4-aminobutyrate aminotransferase-like enzyme
LREVCDEHGILLVIDEVQSGFGRTGRFFACEHAGVTPDIMVMAKGMASGFPISGIASTPALMEKWTTGAHGGTYGGNPMGCAAAEATIRVIQDEGLVENAEKRGRQLLNGLRAIQQRHPSIGEARGLGLMAGCEFVDPENGSPDKDLAHRVVDHLREESGLLLLTCGTFGNVIRWIPPLVVNEEQIDEALTSFEVAVAASVSTSRSNGR